MRVPVAKKLFSISFSPKDIVRRIGLWKEYPRKNINAVMSRIQDDAIQEMRANVPIGTGKLQRSIKSLSRTTATGNFDLRASFAVGSPLAYTKYLDAGTKASPGRYVPVLGRRITTGMHPGIRALNFMQSTKNAMEPRINNIMEDFMKKWQGNMK